LIKNPPPPLAQSLLPYYLCTSDSLKIYQDFDPIAVYLVNTTSKKDTRNNITSYHESIEDFKKAISYFEALDIITIESLEFVNTIFNKKVSKIRVDNCWVGKKGSKTDYKCPSPNKLKTLLESLLSIINTKVLSIDKILYVYFRFISIHPFADGNGRTCRALFVALINNKNDIFLCPFLYHTQNNHFRYYELVKTAYTSEEKFFKCNSLKKIKNDALKLKAKIDDCQQRFYKKAAGYYFEDEKLFHYAVSFYAILCNSPFINLEENTISNHHFLSTPELLNKLLNKSDFKIKKSKYGGTYIYSDFLNTFIRDIHQIIK
jgi:Fic family protein